VVGEDVAELASSVRVVHDPELDQYYPGAYPAIVIVRTRSGQELRVQRLGSVGDPYTPMSDDDLAAKFRRLAEPVIGPGRADALIELFADPEDRSSHDLDELIFTTKELEQQ
jgi:2-methylcitrate dehydratase PrpD